jgi:hypothetical protein
MFSDTLMIENEPAVPAAVSEVMSPSGSWHSISHVFVTKPARLTRRPGAPAEPPTLARFEMSIVSHSSVKLPR